MISWMSNGQQWIQTFISILSNSGPKLRKRGPWAKKWLPGGPGDPVGLDAAGGACFRSVFVFVCFLLMLFVFFSSRNLHLPLEFLQWGRKWGRWRGAESSCPSSSSSQSVSERRMCSTSCASVNKRRDVETSKGDINMRMRPHRAARGSSIKCSTTNRGGWWRVPNNTFKTDIALWCYVCTRVLDWMVSGWNDVKSTLRRWKSG